MKNSIFLLTVVSLCRNSQSAYDQDYINQISTKYNTIGYSHYLPPIYEAPPFHYQQNQQQQQQQQQYQPSPRELFRPPSLHEPIFSEKQKEAAQKQQQKEQQQFQFEKQQPQPFQQQPPKPEEPQQQQQPQPQPDQQKPQQPTSTQQQFSRDFQDYQKRFQQVQQQEYQQRQQFKFEQQQQPDTLQRGLQKAQQEQLEYQRQQERQLQQQQPPPPVQNYHPEYLHNYNFFKSRNFEPFTVYLIVLRQPAPVQEFTDHIRPEPPAKFRLPKPQQGFKPIEAPFKANGYSHESPYYQSKFPNFAGSPKDPSTFLFPIHPKNIPTEELRHITQNAHNYVKDNNNRFGHGSNGEQPISAQFVTRFYPAHSWGQNKYKFQPYHYRHSFVH